MVLGPQNHRPTLDIGDESGSLAAGLGFLVSHVKGTIVYIDEKWIKIKGQWHYWFVVLDHPTGLPIIAELLKSRSQWACQWIGIQLKRIKIIPRVIVTDGLASYRYLL